MLHISEAISSSGEGTAAPWHIENSLGWQIFCLIIALEHSKSQLEGDQLLYQYPGLPKTIASFQGQFPRKTEFPFSSFLTCHCFCLPQRYFPPFCQVKEKSPFCLSLILLSLFTLCFVCSSVKLK